MPQIIYNDIFFYRTLKYNNLWVARKYNFYTSLAQAINHEKLNSLHRTE